MSDPAIIARLETYQAEVERLSGEVERLRAGAMHLLSALDDYHAGAIDMAADDLRRLLGDIEDAAATLTDEDA